MSYLFITCKVDKLINHDHSIHKLVVYSKFSWFIFLNGIVQEFNCRLIHISLNLEKPMFILLCFRGISRIMLHVCSKGTLNFIPHRYMIRNLQWCVNSFFFLFYANCIVYASFYFQICVHSLKFLDRRILMPRTMPELNYVFRVWGKLATVAVYCVVWFGFFFVFYQTDSILRILLLFINFTHTTAQYIFILSQTSQKPM